jgi:DNA ligase-1
MNKLTTLYKTTSTGAVQEWSIFHEEGAFWTISGQTDGKKVTSAKTFCAGKNVGKKNATTANEQAAREARAKWQKKIDEGYVDDPALLNTTSDRVDPMLAKDYEDYKDELVFPVYSQPKMDGLRCVITRHGAFSRKWKPFSTLDHIREALQPVFDSYPSIIALDGEMYSHELKNNFEEIVSVVKQPKATEEDIQKCKATVQYHIYDYVSKDGSPFSQRALALEIMFEKVQKDCLRLVKTNICWNQQELDDEYKWCIIDGYEGQMVRKGTSVYQQKRTKDLLKRKEFMDGEFKIVGYKEGKGNRAGCITLRVSTDEGKEFDSVPTGGVEFLQKLWEAREKLVGLYATIKYQNLSSDGIPRFNNTIKIRDGKSGEEIKFV